MLLARASAPTELMATKVAAPLAAAQRASSIGMSRSTFWKASVEPALFWVVPMQQKTAAAPARGTGRELGEVDDLFFDLRELRKLRRPSVEN